jgi:hypothetical protein
MSGVIHYKKYGFVPFDFIKLDVTDFAHVNPMSAEQLARTFWMWKGVSIAIVAGTTTATGLNFEDDFDAGGYGESHPPQIRAGVAMTGADYFQATKDVSAGAGSGEGMEMELNNCVCFRDHGVGDQENFY